MVGWKNEFHYEGAHFVKYIRRDPAKLSAVNDSQASNWRYYYVVGRLLWDDTIDVDKMLDELDHLYYGPAAGPMCAYQKLRRKLWNDSKVCFGYPLGNPRMSQLLNEPGAKEQLFKYLDEADRLVEEVKVKGEGEDRSRRIFKRRIAQDRGWLERYWVKPNDKFLATRGRALKAPRPSSPIVIDGKGDEDAWRGACYTDAFFLNTESETKPAIPEALKTKVGILADDENFYLLVTAREPHPEKMVLADGVKREAWSGDRMEFFFYPPAVENTYFQFAIGTSGATYARLNPTGEKLDIPVETKTVIGKDSWTMEVKIPSRKKMYDLVAGATWRVHYCRGRGFGDEVSKKASWTLDGTGFHQAIEYRQLEIGAAAKVPAAGLRVEVTTNAVGRIKPMNAVDGAPGRPGTVDFEAWKLLEVPYARLHDAGNHAEYGAPWALEVTRIFSDFDADENDPKNYRFDETDAVVKRVQDAGTKVFYRLGCPFEHQLRKRTWECGMPKDVDKYARICGNIIAHYNKGWANGFHYGIEYWEFWNEPDLGGFWCGTRDEFQKFWIAVAKHVKGRFPEIKFGGPAISGDMNWVDNMIGAFAKEKAPLDFVSWHCYQCSPTYKTRFKRYVQRARDVLDKHGYTKAESILNEWNYCLAMAYEGRRYSTEVHAGREAVKGAAFIGGVLNICQDGPLDMLMLYSGLRGRSWNSLFDLRTNEPIAGYYALYAWKKLRRLGTQVKVKVADGGEECFNAVAAKGADGRNGLFVVRFNENADIVMPAEVTVVLPFGRGRSPSAPAEITCHLTDSCHLYTEVPLIRVDGAYKLKLEPNALAYIEW